MKRILILPILILTLLVANPAFSGDLIKAVSAHRSGDYATALREWKPLAEEGVPSAQNMLGHMYRLGQGVLQDYKTAVKLYELAAEQGHALAQSSLGVMYRKGWGVPQDYVRAHMWSNIAASSGDSENASKNRDIFAKLMTPTQIAEAQKLARECVAKNYKGC